ncbi:MAG TPA: TonB-dependent receptor, partial [Terriglobia bacterium]|nr:TonB-dependent receptor [Terriglobia bacterium]
MRRKLAICVCGLAILVTASLFSPMLYGQVDTGTISGAVRDKSGAVIPNAQVTIRNVGTGQAQHITTNSTGLFVSLPLYAGQYDVEVVASGFVRETQRVTLSVAQRVETDFTLQLGSVRQTVTVHNVAASLQTEESTLSSLQTQKNIENLPLNGPNFAQLMGLAAGVVPAQMQTGAGGGGTPITMKRGVTGYSVNGLRLEENSFLVDGMFNNENHNGLGILVFPPIDAIQEFREENSVADAQFGRGGGGTVNLIYKSGTQHYHGDLFEFLRNSGLDARNFFDRNIPEFRRNQFGATLGGPILPRANSKTFFFADYQGVRTRLGQTFISTVPTLAARDGDFSEYPQRIYDPLSQAPLRGGGFERTQFPGNVIPSPMIDAVGQQL